MNSSRSRAMRPTALAASTIAALVLSIIALEAGSQNAPPSKAEQAIVYRQSVYKVIRWNFAPMAAMAQAKMPYDAQEFAHRAARLSQMAPMLLEGYPAESGSGAPTRARKEIWNNLEEFTTLMRAMEGKAAALATVSQGGDFEQTKAAFIDLGDACKACHDKYRSE